jgi:hypothetical protein
MPNATLRANARTLPIASLTEDPAIRRAFALFGPDPDPAPAAADRSPRPRQDSDAVRLARIPAFA